MPLISFLMSKTRVKLVVPFLWSQDGQKRKMKVYLPVLCPSERRAKMGGSHLLWTGLPLTFWWLSKQNPWSLGSISPFPTPPDVGDQASCAAFLRHSEGAEDPGEVWLTGRLEKAAKCNHLHGPNGLNWVPAQLWLTGGILGYASMRGGQGYVRGMSTGHPESDADEGALQWHRLSGTCSYQIKHRPQEQPAHQWQRSATQPHPACPWPEVELGPLGHSSSCRTKSWSSREALPQGPGLPCSTRWLQEQGKGSSSHLHRMIGGALNQPGAQWALKVQAKWWCVHPYILYLENESTLFTSDSPKNPWPTQKLEMRTPWRKIHMMLRDIKLSLCWDGFPRVKWGTKFYK